MLRRLVFVNFHSVYRLDRWLRRRFTASGSMLLVLAMSAAMFGINTRQTLSYQLFAVLFAALLFAFVASLRFRPGVRLRRRLPRYATNGVPLSYTLEIRNEGARPQRGLSFADYPGAARPDVDAFFRFRESRDKKRNWFDRRVGYPRWLQFMRRREGMTEELTALPDLVPGQRTTARVSLTPRRRGLLKIAPPMLVRPDPLGLCRAARACGEADRVLVLPRRVPVPTLVLPGRSQQPPGLSTSVDRRTGGSDDFAMLRDYRPGDPLRHVHWKSWARLGEPVVMEFHDRHRPRQAVVLDNACAGGDEQVFEMLVSAAASLYAALVDRRAAPGAETSLLCAGVAPELARDPLALLASVQPAPVANLSALIEMLRREVQRLSGCALVLCGWDEARRDLVRQVRRSGVEVVVLVVVADEEPAPAPGPMSDRPGFFHVVRPASLAADLATVGRHLPAPRAA